MTTSNQAIKDETELAHKIVGLAQKLADDAHLVYDNKSLMEKLHIKDKLLKRLRDNGYLGYSRIGDKYWYTQEDVDMFLKHFHYAPFATADGLTMIQGG